MEVTVEQAQSLHPARESGDVGEARRAAVSRAEGLGFDETARGRAALIVTELGTNLIKHAGGGHLVVGTATDSGESCLEILAIDAGPGIRDVHRGLEDGFSTAGTSGNGLGSIRRLSSHFDMYTDATGTVVLARLSRDNPTRRARPKWQIGGICLPIHGEQVCGDGWGYSVNGDRGLVVIVDGLGHGRLAHEAAEASLAVMRTHPGAAAGDLLYLAHQAARGTRGSAAAVAEINLQRSVVTYAGIGNTSGSVVNRAGTSRSMVSQHGILGTDNRRIEPFEYPWDREGLAVFHSDGLGSRWDLRKYPGLPRHDPSIIAAVLYRDYARPRDDVTVVVCKSDAA